MNTSLLGNSKFYGAELLQIIDSVAGEKGFDRAVVISAIEEAIGKAAKTKYGLEFDIRAKINGKTGMMSLVKNVTVVSDDQPTINEYTECRLSDAKKNNPDLEVGDVITEDLPPIEFGRWAAQIGRQSVVQIFRNADKLKQYNSFKDRVGTIVSGIVRKVDNRSIVIEVGRGEVSIGKDQLIPRENFRIGDRIKAYVVEVEQNERGVNIVLSRTHPMFLAQLFKQEVPEIYDGIIDIKSAARDPGSRAKIAVYSHDKNIDPIGACVGVRGSRVQAIVQELQGEKVDIVLWDPDIATFAVNALAPAEISKVILDEDHRCFEVLVPDSQLSLAIGKKGQNIKLASQLINWKLDVISESEEKERVNKEYRELAAKFVEAIGCDEMMAHWLVSEGISSVEELAYIDLEELCSIGEIEHDVAANMQNKAKEFLENKEAEISKKLSNYKVDEDLIALEAFSNEEILSLCENGIMNLQQLADLASDELTDILPGLDSEFACEVVMKARSICGMC